MSVFNNSTLHQFFYKTLKDDTHHEHSVLMWIQHRSYIKQNLRFQSCETEWSTTLCHLVTYKEVVEISGIEIGYTNNNLSISLIFIF